MALSANGKNQEIDKRSDDNRKEEVPDESESRVTPHDSRDRAGD
jgi:hypothetical protein